MHSIFNSMSIFENQVHVSYSLVVVGMLWEKSEGLFLFSFRDSVDPIVSQEKNPYQFHLGNLFYSSSRFGSKLG